MCVEWPAESSGESSRCAWSGRESRHGVAERVVGRVVKVCVEWPRESSGESSRCAWSGRQSRRESRQGVRGVDGRVVTEWPAESSGESSRCAWSGRQSRRESRQGVRGVDGRVVGRVVKVCVEWTGESSRSGRESRRSGQMYGSASSRSRDRTQADGAVIHLELERSCGSIPAGLRGGTSHQVLTRLSSAARAELDGLRPGMDTVAPSSGADGRGLRPNKNYCPLRLWSLRPTKNTTSSRATTGVDKSVFLLRFRHPNRNYLFFVLLPPLFLLTVVRVCGWFHRYCSEQRSVYISPRQRSV